MDGLGMQDIEGQGSDRKDMKGGAAMGGGGGPGGNGEGGRGEESMIVPFLLGLLFEKLVQVLRELTVDQHRLEYWSPSPQEKDIGPDESIFGTGRGGSRVSQLATLLDQYFSCKALSTSSSPDRDLARLILTGRGGRDE